MNRVTLLLALALGSASPLRAQVGNNNPTGPSGIFNGNVTTGCSYDPYTGNAHRVITDIVVGGAVGEYPLALTRTSNSRNAWGSAFGLPGAWRHNYQWTIEDMSTWHQPNMYYRVHFPDGRMETFTSSTSDVDYRAAPGVRERLDPGTIANGTTGFCYLVLPDGGKVEFKGTSTLMTDPELIPSNWYEFTFVATAIIDPYGLRTAFTYDANGRLSKVTEPAGRFLTFTYATVGSSTVISKVTASIGRFVQYNYSTISPGGASYVALSSVVYYNDATWTARYTYRTPNVAPTTGLPLLWTADDPMYFGPMKRIAYQYQTGTNPDGSAPIYGQILSERYYNGTTVGAAVSTLTVGTTANPNARTETRGDGATRKFYYDNPGFPGFLNRYTDFTGHSTLLAYDVNTKYMNKVTDFNGNTTDYTRNALNGNITVTTFPLTQGDTPGQTQRPSTQYTYGSPSCADPNNQDANNPYYVCTASDEGGNVTQFLRNANKRITRINYPDGGYETFTYNSFGQVLTHRMRTGGTETFTYDVAGLKQTYRNPSNASGNPTARYQYNNLHWVTQVTDALGASLADPYHTTSFSYNLRGQVTVTTLPNDPVDELRHTITNAYNPDGTLASTTDQLNHVTSYTYDDYRRLKSVTPPVRGFGDTSPHTTYLFYDASGTGDDYQYADSNVTYVTLPSGKRITATYDDNRRKMSVTAAIGTADAATTSFTYDNVGNVTEITDPSSHTTTTTYDERNRPSSVTDALSNTTTFTYDTAGRKKSVTRPNGLAVTYNTFDAMNRVLQQTVKQTPGPDAVTKYTYTQAGLLATMQDPLLVATAYKYTYAYDTSGRKTSVTYPPDSGGAQRTETFTYDTAGRLATSKNRNGKTQTFTYDRLNRMVRFTWDDGITPTVNFGYDVASRLTVVNNANATISRTYFNDNLLRSETESITGGTAATVAYTYDANGNRDTLLWSGSDTVSYTYTGRNQLKNLTDGSTTLATYNYNVNGDLISRVLDNSTSSSYSYDALDRVMHITHALNGTSRTFDYDYDNVGNRTWTKRDGGTGDVFGYDRNDQVTAVKLNIANPDTTAVGAQTIFYDANGNRTSFAAYGTTDTYTINNNSLNQYTRRNAINAAYNLSGDLTTGVDGSTYVYDAQNRLLSASKSGVTESFKYDGLNRQVSRTAGGVTSYSVWDGWDLVQEYQGAGTVVAAYLHGATGLVKNLLTNNYYYQDGSGSTSHLASSGGALLEWYRYDLQGTPIFYNAADQQISGSNQGVRHLFTGQQWYSELGLYDLRNRFYSPDIGRFLQPDPIGFRGDRTNLYRYCRNNPVNRSDPSGLADIPLRLQNSESDWPGVVVNGGMWQSPTGDPARGLGPMDQSGGAPGEGGINRDIVGLRVGEGYVYYYTPFPRPEEDNSPSTQQPAPSAVPPQNPPLPSPSAAQPTNLPWIVVTILNPSPFEPVSIMMAYPRAHQVRIEGHHLFPDPVKDSSARHRWGARTLTREIGPTTTRNLGVLNEIQGFIWHDLPNLGSRLSGRTPWAFQLQDLVNNEIGIWEELLGEED